MMRTRCTWLPSAGPYGSETRDPYGPASCQKEWGLRAVSVPRMAAVAPHRRTQPADHRHWLALRADPLTFQDSSNFLKRGSDVARGKPDLSEAFDVGELLAPLFQHEDGSSEAKPALE